MELHGFGPAFKNERVVYGAQRPKYPGKFIAQEHVEEWISFMKDRGIKRVCCLLAQDQLAYYEEDLLNTYRKRFGTKNVCWAPVKDFHLMDTETLKGKVIPFLMESESRGEPVVVHCSGGNGRSGQVLAAWLIFKHGFTLKKAISTVKKMGRNPCEAVDRGNATTEELNSLLVR